MDEVDRVGDPQGCGRQGNAGSRCRELAVEELAVAVGEATWKAVMTDLDKRMSRHFRE